MIVKEEIKGSKLYNVPLGGLFKHGDRFFIKADRLCIKADICCLEEACLINCVDVKSGHYTYIDDFAFVEYCPNAFISVRDK